MIMVKISVIMSVYGYEEYIGASIASIVNQSFKEWELIIIDDGCSYNLETIVNSFDDSRIKLLQNQSNIGLTPSLNKGIDGSRGKYIARQDAGNISYGHRLEVQYNYLEKNPDLFLLGSSVKLVDEKGMEICKKIAVSGWENIKKKLPQYNLFFHSTIFFKNQDKIRYREKFKYAQDYDFYLTLLSQQKKMDNLKQVLVEERYVDSSITFGKRQEQEGYAQAAKAFYVERIEKGRDSYDKFSIDQLETNEGKQEDLNFFARQKAHYLLFSGKKIESRKIVQDLIKKEFSKKLIYYLWLSYMPNFFISIIKKIKGIAYE